MLLNYGQQQKKKAVAPFLPYKVNVCVCVYVYGGFIGVLSHMKREFVENLSIKGHI